MCCLEGGNRLRAIARHLSRAECEALVGAIRYAPKGFRSFGPTRAIWYAGSDYATQANDNLLAIAMPALKLDAALLHVNRSDWRGNVQLFGPDVYYDEWFAKAATQCFVSAEELVPAMEDAYPEDARANLFERCFVTGVTEAKGGAHPTSLPPDYGWDMGWFKKYAAAAKDPGDWASVAAQFVGASEAEYLASVGGMEAVGALPLPVF